MLHIFGLLADGQECAAFQSAARLNVKDTDRTLRAGTSNKMLNRYNKIHVYLHCANATESVQWIVVELVQH